MSGSRCAILCTTRWPQSLSLSLRKSWRCCCFEWGHNATTFSFFFTRYFLFFFYLNVVETRAMLPLSLSPIFAASSCVEGVCVLAKKKNWINIHQGGWMLSINRITLVKERDKSKQRVDWNWRVTFFFSKWREPSIHPSSVVFFFFFFCLLK